MAEAITLHCHAFKPARCLCVFFLKFGGNFGTAPAPWRGQRSCAPRQRSATPTVVALPLVQVVQAASASPADRLPAGLLPHVIARPSRPHNWSHWFALPKMSVAWQMQPQNRTGQAPGHQGVSEQARAGLGGTTGWCAVRVCRATNEWAAKAGPAQAGLLCSNTPSRAPTAGRS